MPVAAGRAPIGYPPPVAEHHRLRQILQTEFTRIAEEENRPPFSDAQKAKRLHISAAQLSYLLRGERRLTPETAELFVERLAGDDAALAERLRRDLGVLSQAPRTLREFEERLLAVTPPTELDPRKAGESFFQLLSRAGWFLCVEYRDLPRAADEYRPLGEAAGKAVADGLCFAMIQPFGTDFGRTSGDSSPPTMLLLFLEKLMLKVREVYKVMLHSAERVLAGRVPDPRATARERLVLYERQGRPLLGTGIQSRLFYCEHSDQNEFHRAVFEWIAGERADLFFRRTGSIDTDAFSAQFAPIIEFWRANDHVRLPRSADDLRRAVALAKDLHDGAGFSPDFWRPYES